MTDALPNHPTERIAQYLISQNVSFRRFTHRPATTVIEYNRTLRCRFSQQVMVLLLKIRKSEEVSFAPYALPGGKRADFRKLEGILNADKVSLCSPEEMFEFTGCCYGELHPIASIYGMKLILDGELMLEKEVLFNAGTHEQSIALSPDFLKENEADIVIERFERRIN